MVTASRVEVGLRQYSTRTVRPFSPVMALERDAVPLSGETRPPCMLSDDSKELTRGSLKHPLLLEPEALPRVVVPT
jgi:hypothetical protein